ncbi:ABC transporter ATP-binding protein [Amorphus coralli]|uniref:ABC transporter ATP-binding protein n=1 Tax=Amorphus coralli TaxID=340680 RepID=UPI0003784B50|nr:ABC transporter ATP-binding protein [Amorphus coralli]
MTLGETATGATLHGRDQTQDPDPAIDVRTLTYAYPGSAKPAVEAVSLTIQPGEIFGLLGPSGAGKTTLQRILTKQLAGYEGNASVLGRPLGDWDRAYFEEIGVGFELPNHYLRFTAAENLAFFASLYARPCRPTAELLERVGLTDAADRKVETFSKGMRMRLNFVRAIQHAPRILFLDEPTAGLDPVNAGIVKQIIRELRAAGTTIVLTTHNMSDVDELCDRVAFMLDGRLATTDAPEALKARYGRRTVTVTFNGPSGLSRETFPLDGLGNDARFLELLRSARVERIHSQEASLDRVFREVTGVHLEAEQ